MRPPAGRQHRARPSRRAGKDSSDVFDVGSSSVGHRAPRRPGARRGPGERATSAPGRRARRRATTRLAGPPVARLAAGVAAGTTRGPAGDPCGRATHGCTGAAVRSRRTHPLRPGLAVAALAAAALAPDAARAHEVLSFSERGSYILEAMPGRFSLGAAPAARGARAARARGLGPPVPRRARSRRPAPRLRRRPSGMCARLLFRALHGQAPTVNSPGQGAGERGGSARAQGSRQAGWMVGMHCVAG
jgi:hypothetical protein